jgi:hypothetical protein
MKKAKPAKRSGGAPTEPAEAANALYVRTDISPEQMFRAMHRLHKRVADTIDELILVLNELDGDPEAEPALGSVEGPIRGKRKARGQASWTQGDGDDREGDGCADDREGDELQHGGDEHDGAEPEVDTEPSLGWTVDGQIVGNPFDDFEQGVGPSDQLLQKKHDLHRRFPEHGNRDGMHVESERAWAGRKRLRNLSDRQKKIVAPRVDIGKVSVT